MIPALPTAGPFRASTAGAIRQGEIISDLVTYERNLLQPKGSFDEQLRPFAIVVSQDCDLDWDYKSRFANSQEPSKSTSKELPNVLFCMAQTASETRSAVLKTEFWKRIQQNKDERYQFLEQVPPAFDLNASGLPELVLDFKRYFTIPTIDVYDQVQSTAQRRCILNNPYLEHFSSRFVYYQGRVALPADHASMP